MQPRARPGGSTYANTSLRAWKAGRIDRDASLQDQERQGAIEVFIGAADCFGCTIAARHYDNDTIAELTMIIAWKNASSRSNRAFRIPSQEFWRP